MSQQPESGPPVLKLYAIELPDGSIAMNGPYVLATENEGQAGRMAHARDGQEIAFVRELQQAQGVGWPAGDGTCGWTLDFKFLERVRQVAETKGFGDDVPSLEGIEATLIAALEVHPLATPQSSAPVVGEHVRRLVGKLAQWQHCMSYNESYFGEPAGLVKQVTAELAHAIDPIYPPMTTPVDPLAGVTIYTSESALTGRG